MASWVCYSDEQFFSKISWKAVIEKSNKENLFLAFVDICDRAATMSFLDFEQWSQYLNKLDIKGLTDEHIDLLSAITTPLEDLKHLKIGKDNFRDLVNNIINPNAPIEEHSLFSILNTPKLIEAIWEYIEDKDFLVKKFQEEALDLSEHPFIEKYILDQSIKQVNGQNSIMKI